MTLRSNKSIKKAVALSLCFALAVPFVGPASEVSAAEPSAAPDYVENYDDYSLVWNDEFDGETLNTDDWNVELHEPGWVNSELQRYTKLNEGNIKVEGGSLKLIPKAEKKADGGSAVSNGNVLKGEGFDANWYGGVNSGIGAAGSVEIGDGQAVVKIENSGSENYGIQVQQGGLTLKPGHSYHLEFNAVATTDRATQISMLNNPDSLTWDWIDGKSTVIGTEESKIELDFEYGADKEEVKDVVLQLNFGKIDGYTAENGAAEVTLSDIAFVDLSETDGSVDVKSAYNYTSGRVNTQNKHDFTYGYFECAARVPSGQGYLPAFWLMATDETNYGQWPRCGEVDIMEVMGQDTKLSYHTIHYGYDAKKGHKENQKKNALTTGDYSTEYHVYGLDWEPGEISWYVDGVKIGSSNDWYTGKNEETRLAYPAPFDQDFYVILNLAVGGSWVGYPDQAVVDDMDNQSFDIDYVRVYQKEPAAYAEMEAELKEPEHKTSEREPDEFGNYVVNGDFSQDLKPMDSAGDNFELYLLSDCKATTYSIENNEITIVPSAEGEQSHSIQLKQTGIPMIKGWNYELTFDAYADSPRDITIDVEGPDNGWTRYFNDKETGKDMLVSLTGTKKTYTYNFTMEDKTDYNCSLEFNLGKLGTTVPVHISNVSLKYVDGEEIKEEFQKTIAPDGNYVYNGTFDQGEGRLGYWEVAEDDKDNVSVTNTVAEGERKRELRVKIEVPDNASPINPVVVSQSELAPIAKEEYNFFFDAYTPDGESDGMTAIFAGKEFVPELSAEKQTFCYDYSVEDYIDREDAEVSFVFTKGGTYYLDNVVFREAKMIINGSFNSELAGYEYGTYEEGDATFGVDSQKTGNDTAFDADIKDTGKFDYSVQLKQPGIALEKGKWYKLIFDAKATVDRTISVVMQRDGSEDDNWDVYSGANNIELGSKWKTYEKVFQMTADTDTNTLLSVSLGTFDGDRIKDVHHVYLDNFVIEETEEPDEPTPTTEPTEEPSELPSPSSEPSKVPSSEPSATPAAEGTPSAVPSGKPGETTPTVAPSGDVTPSALPTVSPSPAKKDKDKKTTFKIGIKTLKNKKTIKKTAKIKVTDKDKIKKITLNGKKVKIKKNKTSATVNLKNYKKQLKKGKWNVLKVTDKKGNTKSIKFKIKK